MKNLSTLKAAISIFCRIFVGPYYVGRVTQNQLKYNEKLVGLKTTISVFLSDYHWLYYVGRRTHSQLNCNKKPKPTKM